MGPHSGRTSAGASGYDVIGDIHGQADALEALLARLGYRKRGGAWRWPDGGRQAVFVGDYIDRNPHARRVLEIVQGMTDSGAALAAMGNHEFNAVCYHTRDPADTRTYLRPHSDKNRRQHREFLKEMEGDAAAHDAAIAWFRTLPMWLDFGGLRIVHAAWIERCRAVVERAAEPEAHLSDALRVASCRRGSPQHEAVECLLKGLEVPMPDGVAYTDSYGIRRTRARVRWWLAEPPRLLRDAILAAPAMVAQVGDAAWSGAWPTETGYPAGAPPVLLGHYWLDGEPAPLAPNIGCVDYSGAFPGKKLVAYRWDGEERLGRERFVSVRT